MARAVLCVAHVVESPVVAMTVAWIETVVPSSRKSARLLPWLETVLLFEVLLFESKLSKDRERERETEREREREREWGGERGKEEGREDVNTT